MAADFPCRTCTKRQVGCHSTCPEYRAVKAAMDQKRAKAEIAKGIRDANEMHFAAVTKTLRKIHRKRRW